MLYRTKTGEKLYPICKWEPNQHKLYNAYDRTYLAMVDSDYSDETVEAHDRAERALEAFDKYVIDGIVYATWENGNLIKDFVAAYNARF